MKSCKSNSATAVDTLPQVGCPGEASDQWCGLYGGSVCGRPGQGQVFPILRYATRLHPCKMLLLNNVIMQPNNMLVIRQPHKLL